MPRRNLPPPQAAGPSPGQQSWLLAAGSAVLWQIDPGLVEIGELACTVACATSQDLARASVMQLRAKAAELRGRITPLGARAVDKVVRRAERASGSVLDKRARLHELQASWDDLVTCLRITRRQP